ncbi:MAG: hypothetical protein ACR2OR_15380 [Hyphomicrobiales bacterium]
MVKLREENKELKALALAQGVMIDDLLRRYMELIDLARGDIRENRAWLAKMRKTVEANKAKVAKSTSRARAVSSERHTRANQKAHELWPKWRDSGLTKQNAIHELKHELDEWANAHNEGVSKSEATLHRICKKKK